VIKPKDDIADIILESAKRVGGLKDGDVVVISSSAVSTAKGRLKKLSSVKPSIKAIKLSKATNLEPEFVELVLREADYVLGAVKGVVLTLKDGLLCANACVDHSNVPPGYVSLLPKSPNKIAKEILRKLKRGSDVRLGVVISDSHIQPLRLGTIGVAIGVAGVEPVIDCRRKPDIYGRRLRITYRAIADQLATAAQILMGETNEQTPAVIVRGANVTFAEKVKTSPKISPKRCMYADALGINKLIHGKR
jgi:coenzyme F420-0:L-glutamate ligase